MKTIDSQPEKPKTSRGEQTRRKLLEAAEQEFGTQGFQKASVSGITRRAGVGQGTFYIYFRSKEEVLRELVLHMGRLLRRSLSEHSRSGKDRLEIERMGLVAFFNFVREHRNLYRIVKESQFVDEAAYRSYYSDFADAYRERLEQASAAGDIRPGYAEERAWAIMGMIDFLGMRYAIWQEDASVDAVVEACMDLLTHGLQPVPRAR